MGKQIEVIARGVARSGGRVLACRNDEGGYFYLPGGHVEFGESATEALRREFREECGADITTGSLALVGENSFSVPGKEHHEFNLVFHVELATDSLKSQEQGISFHWLDVASLVDIDFRPESTKAWLMSGGNEPTWTSDFPSESR